ncbi:hypothetical protein [Persicitalea jodogahamensis]|uniref:Uncharacterized protein n=1 Tax=Persicitalea jodogahamensis TaxID=402147 RepID=A0A8J3GC14_9BACT|nr:hypothetical protein [Persicitalea jodogahamensis]GHB81349.1 hypothetical protein GCM10007390_40210 [Persicitalea jodogahamensis]
MPLKKLAIPVLIVAILAVATYFLMRDGRSLAAWKYIPANASAVITSNRLQDSTFLVTESAINVKQFPLVNEAGGSLSLLLWITPDERVFERTLRKKNLTYSYHPRTSSGFGLILYVPLANEMEVNWWSKPNRQDVRVLRHSYQGESITDINDLNSKPVCSYIIKDNYLIVSQYGDLIEDVVRRTSESVSQFPLEAEFQKADDSGYGMNLYLKSTIWKNLLSNSLSSQPAISEYYKLLPALQDFHLVENNDSRAIFESGGGKTGTSYLNEILNGQKGKAFRSHRFISQKTSMFYRIASGDSLDFKENFEDWHDDQSSPAWDKLKYHIGNERQVLVNNVGSELILCQIEGNNSITDGKIALIEYSNYEKLKGVLTKLARLSTNESNVSLDKYQGYDLFSVPIAELPAALYGPMFGGFPRSYITYVAPYLVLSNSSQGLRNYISDFENRITWQQSPELDSIFISRQLPAQVSMVASLRKMGTTSNAGGIFSDNVESILFESVLDGRIVVPKISILPKKRRTSGKVLNRTFLAGEIEWAEGNQGLIAISQNQDAGASQLLLTDEKHQLLRPNPGYDKTLPITLLDGPLVDAPLRVDFLNIGRQQLILATANSLYAIDEDDNGLVTPIRIGIPSGQDISRLIRIEGGSEGSSRFVVIDAAENIFLWESAGKVPIKINRFKSFSGLKLPLVSLNQLGSRSLIVTQDNGLIYLIKEDGSIRPGFPVDMLTRISSAFSWSQNAATGQPELVGVSTLGELLRADLGGKVLERRQLYRPESSSRFSTLFDQNSLDWLLLRISNTKAAILDQNGSELFEIENIAPNSVLQYHYFGVDNRFISISSGGYTSIFDLTGRRLGDKPIPSDLPVRISYQPSYYKIFIFAREAGKYKAWTIKIR